MSILFGAVSADFSGAGVCLRPAGGLSLLVARRPALSSDSAPIPLPPFPAGRGGPRLFYARGFAPCIPGLNPRGTGSTCRCRRLNGGAPPALLARRALAVPGGGLPSLSPAAPAFSLLFCPLSPRPRSQSDLPRWGRGRPRLFYARGFAPCIPGNRPGGTGYACGKPVLRALPGNTCFAAVKSASGHSIIEKSSWGFGGFFQEAPNVSPVSPVPPRCTPSHAGRNCKLHKNAQNG